MSGCVSMNLGFSSPLKTDGEGTIVNKKHGIVSILGSDSDNRSSRASSLRRTLSADMSSKKWLSQNGLSSPPKKNASQESRGGGGGGGGSEVKSAFDIWISIQEEKKKEIEGERNGQVDAWGSILSEKTKDICMGKSVPPPYVHPLVRRSKSSLSERSLEICTESLGSETGSEGFSWYNLSEKREEGVEEKDDVGNFQELQKEPEKQEFRAWKQEEPFMAAKSSCLGDKKSTQRSFPPPIRSLSRQDGASTYMRTRRDNGRLVLEAVEILSKDNFCAQRQDGRLVLTFAKANQKEDKTEEITDEMEQEKEENGFESSEEEEGEGHDEMEMRFAMEQAPKFSATHGLISVHRLALMVNKRIRANLWSSKNLNDIIKPKGSEKEEEEEEEEEEKPEELEKPKPKSQFLPPRPRPRPPAATITTSLNVYEYYWRPKPMRMGSTDEKGEQQYVVVATKFWW